MNTWIRHLVRFVGLPALLGGLLMTACSDADAPTAPAPPKTATHDTSPPTPVVDANLTFDGKDAILTWTAPFDDNGIETYDIRYSYSFPLHWDLALRAEDPPTPLAPGRPQSYTIADPLRGRDLFAAIRSIDPSGNVSPTSAPIQVRIQGYTAEIACAAVFTGEPVAGLDITVTSRHVQSHVTDAAGRAIQDDLTAGTVNVAIRPGSSGVPYHYINDPFNLTGDTVRPYRLIPYEPTVRGIFESTLQMFKAVAGTSSRPVFKKWRTLPVPLYIPTYVNANGIDYTDLCMRAARRWEERTGIDLWRFVSQPADTGVVFFFKTRAQMGINVGVTVHVNGPDGYPLQDEVSVVDSFGADDPLYRTMLHELGHTIRFDHLPSGYLMFAGQPLPSDVTDDEAMVARLYTAMPNGIDATIYDHTIPAEALGAVDAGGRPDGE